MRNLLSSLSIKRVIFATSIENSSLNSPLYEACHPICPRGHCRCFRRTLLQSQE
ncbi:hypothetical protein EVA_02414 [gut metagenome]|uniref:Uncharacterized protein n=1 Tax=gut metagenome TaxID=749906 RepID=J9H613_9ZZZZ